MWHLKHNARLFTFLWDIDKSPLTDVLEESLKLCHHRHHCSKVWITGNVWQVNRNRLSTQRLAVLNKNNEKTKKNDCNYVSHRQRFDFKLVWIKNRTQPKSNFWYWFQFTKASFHLSTLWQNKAQTDAISILCLSLSPLKFSIKVHHVKLNENQEYQTVQRTIPYAHISQKVFFFF